MKPGAKPFESLMPLPEVIGASVGRGAAGVRVQREYQRLLAKLGPEFEILRNIPPEDIRRAAGGRMAEGVQSPRNGQGEGVPGLGGG